MKMKSIKSIYEFVVLIQVICLIFMVFMIFEEGLDKSIQIGIMFTEEIGFSFDFRIDYNTIILFIVALAGIFVLSSLKLFDSGVSDEGQITIKHFIAFISLFMILSTPILVLMEQSIFLYQFSGYVLVFLLLIHTLHLLTKIGGMNE